MVTEISRLYNRDFIKIVNINVYKIVTKLLLAFGPRVPRYYIKNSSFYTQTISNQIARYESFKKLQC